MKDGAPPNDGYRIVQVGYVVADLESTMRAYHERFGWGPWRIFTLAPPAHNGVTLHGVPVTSSLKIAIADAGGIDIELIQPLDGASQHAEFLERHGPGINHILLRNYVDGQELTIDPAVFGLPDLMSGRNGTALSYSYLDGRDELATVIEVARGSNASQGILPDAIYPAGD